MSLSHACMYQKGADALLRAEAKGFNKRKDSLANNSNSNSNSPANSPTSTSTAHSYATANDTKFSGGFGANSPISNTSAKSGNGSAEMQMLRDELTASNDLLSRCVRTCGSLV